MTKRMVVGPTLLALAACNFGGGELEIGHSEQGLWAACTAESRCPNVENCQLVYESEDYRGFCIRDTENPGNREECSSSKRYCCQDVWCAHRPGADIRYRIVGSDGPACSTGKSCERCPGNQVRHAQRPWQCCNPTLNCSGRCGFVRDNCGRLQDCGSCPSPDASPPPPPPCPSGQVCCEPGPNGSCNLCRPSWGHCP